MGSPWTSKSLIDVEKEHTRQTREIEKDIAHVSKKLGNEKFMPEAHDMREQGV